MSYTRRQFLENASALGAASLLGFARPALAEPPPEVTKLRLAPAPVLCTISMRFAEELLRLEGFKQIEYVPDTDDDLGPDLVASGHADFAQTDVAQLLPMMDAGKSIQVLAGLHAGCQALIANDKVLSIGDLKGKRIGISAMHNGDHIFISSILAYVGISPSKDVTWVVDPVYSREAFIKGKVDAIMAFAPEQHDLHSQKIGHVILDLLKDKPWSQHFCCIVAGNRDFVRANPVATKRVLRAILKASDLCVSDPERVARYETEKGFEKRYDVALAVIKELPYGRWREANPEDTLRFHALRLYDVGMVKTSPNKLIAQGTDWRFLNELKKELKA
jgi:NitT/TauT family transport system substrate-binding protein